MHNHSCNYLSMHDDRRSLLLLAKVVCGISLLSVGLRFLAYSLSHSLILKGFFTEGCKDALISLFNVLILWFSRGYFSNRYPHEKFEACFSLLQATILATLGASIFIEAYQGHTHSHFSMSEQLIVTCFLGASLLCLIILAWVQTYFAKKLKSPILQADSAHYKADIGSSLAVVACFLTAHKFSWIDSVCGIGIAVYLEFMAFRIGKESVTCLLRNHN